MRGAQILTVGGGGLSVLRNVAWEFIPWSCGIDLRAEDVSARIARRKAKRNIKKRRWRKQKQERLMKRRLACFAHEGILTSWSKSFFSGRPSVVNPPIKQIPLCPLNRDIWQVVASFLPLEGADGRHRLARLQKNNLPPIVMQKTKHQLMLRLWRDLRSQSSKHGLFGVRFFGLCDEYFHVFHRMTHHYHDITHEEKTSIITSCRAILAVYQMDLYVLCATKEFDLSCVWNSNIAMWLLEDFMHLLFRGWLYFQHRYFHIGFPYSRHFHRSILQYTDFMREQRAASMHRYYSNQYSNTRERVHRQYNRKQRKGKNRYTGGIRDVTVRFPPAQHTRKLHKPQSLLQSKR